MRNWIALIESVQEQHASLEQLAAMRDEFIVNPGTDADYDQILDQLEMSGDEEAEEINAAFFDDRMAHYRQIAATGSVKVYRCISVRNLAKFIASINKRPLGCSWASDEESASCEYHPEANHDHEIMLVAQAPMSSIHWDTWRFSKNSCRTCQRVR